MMLVLEKVLIYILIRLNLAPLTLVTYMNPIKNVNAVAQILDIIIVNIVKKKESIE